MIINRSIVGAFILTILLAATIGLFAATGDASGDGSNETSIPQHQVADKTTPSAESWGFYNILLVLGCFGAFGGGLAAFSQVTFSEVIKSGIQAYGSGKKLAGIVSVGALLGCGGSLAFGFVLAVDRKFGNGVFDLDTKMLIAAASVAAGFSGIRLLKLVSDELAKKVQKQETDINNQSQELVRQQQALQGQVQSLQQQQAKLQEQEVKLGQERQLAEALSFAGGIMGGSDDDRSLDGYRRDAIALLEKAREFFPTSRSIGVYLGRLYRQLKDYPNAIKELQAMFDKRRLDKLPPDKDDATLIYNKACYLNLLARTKNGQEKIQLRDEARKILKEAEALDAELKEYAKTDKDWIE